MLYISPLLAHFFPFASLIYCLTWYPESVLQTHKHTHTNDIIIILSVAATKNEAIKHTQMCGYGVCAGVRPQATISPAFIRIRVCAGFYSFATFVLLLNGFSTVTWCVRACVHACMRECVNCPWNSFICDNMASQRIYMVYVYEYI